MTTMYTIEQRFSRQQYSQAIEADDADSAYDAYVADPGDFTNSDDEPFDRDDLIISDSGQVRCDCGECTGVRCEWVGPRSETVVVEYMPEHLRASHEAARNRGVYPHNGALRLRVEQSCADAIIEDSGDWARIVA